MLVMLAVMLFILTNNVNLINYANLYYISLTTSNSISQQSSPFETALMEAFEIFPRVDTASFNRQRWIREGTFSIVTDVELLKVDAFFLARLEQEASVLFSGLRCGVEAQLFCFENEFTNFLTLSDGKDEAFLVLALI